MSTIRKFKDIEVWQKSRELCNNIYKTTLNKSFSKDFELKNQILASSGSIMDNIAEGFEYGCKRIYSVFIDRKRIFRRNTFTII